jgi:hypothetical protein
MEPPLVRPGVSKADGSKLLRGHRVLPGSLELLQAGFERRNEPFVSSNKGRLRRAAASHGRRRRITIPLRIPEFAFNAVPCWIIFAWQHRLAARRSDEPQGNASQVLAMVRGPFFPQALLCEKGYL